MVVLPIISASNNVWILIFILSLTIISQSNSQTHCPMHCSICLPNFISCTNGGLFSIPTQLQSGTERIQLAGQYQFYGILTSANFSHLAPPNFNIDNLTIRSSSIQELRPKTFSQLTHLKFLDLSENQRLTIFSSTFDGLNLKHLKLDDIGKLMLLSDCFNGLMTEILSMKNSRLQSLNFEIFRPLSHTLKHLFIENNQIRTLDQRFEPLFYRLESVNLKDNPLICYCPLLWLSKALRSKLMSYKYQIRLDNGQPNDANNYPKCVAPSYLRNRQLQSISEPEFNCQVPRIAQIEIDLKSIQDGEMSCRIQPEEKGHKIPTRIFWQENPIDEDNPRRFKNKLSAVIERISPEETEPKDTIASIKISPSGTFRKKNFRCIAENTAGRTTISVQLSWPTRTLSNKSRAFNKSSDQSKKKYNFNTVTTESYAFTKQYTLLELTVAIVGTFIGTVLLFLLFYRLYFRHQNGYKSGKPCLKYSITGDSPTFNTRSLMAFHSPKGGYTVYETSMHYSDNSQTYDSIPQNSVYPSQQQPLFSNLSNSPSAHFIDYKTHKNLYPSSPL